MIRGGPDRAKASQTYTLKRIDYSQRMARRLSQDTRQPDIDGHTRVDAIDPKLTRCPEATLDAPDSAEERTEQSR